MIQKNSLLILSLLLFLCGCSSPLSKVTNIHSSFGESIICFGDSLTAGQGAGKGEDFPSLIRPKVDLPVINMGESGETTDNAISKLDSVLKMNPRIVIVEFGANDFLRSLEGGIGKAETSHIKAFKNLKMIILKLQDAGAVVIVAGVGLNDYYKDGYRKLASDTHAVLIPDIMAGITGDQHYLSEDNKHPNAAGYRKMADTIYAVLAQVLEEMSK